MLLMKNMFLLLMMMMLMMLKMMSLIYNDDGDVDASDVPALVVNGDDVTATADTTEHVAL
jgi:hypothetical protein